jgi:hypothetical protein
MRYRRVDCVELRKTLISQFPACDQIQVFAHEMRHQWLIFAKILQLAKVSCRWSTVRLLAKVRVGLEESGGRDLDALFRISRQPEHVPLRHLSLPLEHGLTQCRVESAEGFKVHFIVT